MSDFFDPYGIFQPGSIDCDPFFSSNECYQGIYEPPIVFSTTTVIYVNDNAAALGSVQTAVNNLTGITASIVTLLGGLFQLLVGLLGLLKTLWEKQLKPLTGKIKDAIDKLQKKLSKILKPIMDALKQQRQQILDIYNKFIRPLIVFIESIRHFIHILQLFHIHLLDKLDAQLAKLERKIMGPFLAALGRINTLSNWISFILNGKLLIFRGLYLGSMHAYRGGAFSMMAATPGYGMPLLPAAGTTPATQPDPPMTHTRAVTAINGAIPAIATGETSGPATELLECWIASFTNVEVKGATEEMVDCILQSVHLAA